MNHPRTIEGEVIRISVAVGEESKCDVILMVQTAELQNPVTVQATFKGDYDPMHPLDSISGRLRLTMAGDEIVARTNTAFFIEEILQFSNLTLEKL